MPAAIVEANSADVDGVAGATVTSDAIKNAVKDALSSKTQDSKGVVSLKEATPFGYKKHSDVSRKLHFLAGLDGKQEILYNEQKNRKERQGE